MVLQKGSGSGGAWEDGENGVSLQKERSQREAELEGGGVSWSCDGTLGLSVILNTHVFAMSETEPCSPEQQSDAAHLSTYS